MSRKRVLASGRVQGVFFRDSCAQQAQRAGVAGWVRNTTDGRVEAVFEGAEEAVDRLVGWMRHGPTQAQVTDLEAREEEPTGLSGFAVH